MVWIDEVGEIPDGHHIHHKNHDPSDNILGNLECIPASEHAMFHYLDRTDLRPSQKQWANSDYGKSVLRENMLKLKRAMPNRSLTCGGCGRTFETKHPAQRYCTTHCQENHNWIIKNCEVCDKEFRAKKHNTREVRTCSYRCGWMLRRTGKRLQPDG